MNPEEKDKHGKFTIKFPNNGVHEKRNRSRSRSETQKMVSKGHLPHMRRKTVQVKSSHLMNEGSIQNIRLRDYKDFTSLYEGTEKKM